MGERDEPHSYHRSLSLEGELLPRHHGDGGEVIGEGGDLPSSALVEFSPSNLQLQISVSVFLCFGGAPFVQALGVFI